MKRLIGAFLSAIIGVCMISSVPAFKETVYAETEGIFTYTVSNYEAEITGCDITVSGELTIPSTLGGYPVTRIGASAFDQCYMLTSVTIPDSVTSIGDSAFIWCESLTSVTIPSSVKSIADFTFSNCSSLSSVTIPGSVTSIGANVFNGCISLTSVTIPDSVTSIGGGAFGNCCSLSSVTIPNSVTSIGGGVFGNCSSLSSVTIPDSITSIEDYTFQWCTSLTSVTIPDSVTNIGYNVFEGCSSLVSINVGNNNYYYSSRDGVLFNKSKTVLVTYPCGKSGGYAIPSSVISIDEYAFAQCVSLTSVTIPNSVKSIGNNSFESCYNLASVIISNSVTCIGECAFHNCRSLTSLTIPNSVISIETSAFVDCSSLTSVTIPSSVKSIGIYAFMYCSSELTIYCSAGSYPESYAKSNGIKYAPYTEFPFAITNISVADGITVNTENYDSVTENLPILLIAIYNGQNKLLNVIKMEMTANTNIYTVDTNIPSDMAKVRVFMWDNLNDIIPVALPGVYVK